MLLSVLIFSCDPDKEEKKKQPETEEEEGSDDDDESSDTPAPVDSLDAVSSKTAEKDGGEDARTKADKSGMELGWVFQGKEITFSTTAKDKDDNKIPEAKFQWEWRKRGKTETTMKFGHTWTPITGQTTKTATLTIPPNQRVGAYELRVSAKNGSQTAAVKSPKEENPKTYYRFTVRKASCAPPSTKYRPAIFGDLTDLVNPPESKKISDDIPAIDVSRITSMDWPFYGDTNFNVPINCWDVSDVTNMQRMFNGALMFDQDIGDWDTSKVEIMDDMFKGASVFNQDISRWDTSEVRNMNNIFNGAAKFNQNLSGWDLTNIVNYNNFDTGAPDWEDDNKLQWPKKTP